MVLGVFRLMPRWTLRGLFALAENPRGLGPLGAGLRLLWIGVKGVVMTLYWSDLGRGVSVHETIGWDARVGEPDTSKSGGTMSVQSRPPAEMAREAFERARAGQASLRRLSVADRARHLDALRRVVLARREEIVGRIHQETRKTLGDALISEIFGVLDNLAWLAREAPRELADKKVSTPLALMGKSSWIFHEPLGTILVISPWNYPFYQALVPIAAALVSGNTVVYKPSEWTPLEGLIESLLGEAGVPADWVRIAYGDGAVGEALIDERPDKIFFTGSTRTGRKVMRQAAERVIPVELELGGKDAMIVFDDVNQRRAAAGAAWGAFTCTGQSCTSVERLYVQESIYESFRAALVDETTRIKVSGEATTDADVGAMTTDFQVAIVARQVEDAKARGARFLTGGEWDGQSRLIPPMVVDEMREDMLLAREETFGPLLPLFRFRTEDEVVRMANDSEYGLTASVWSKDLDRARRVARALSAGGVSINNVMLTEGNPALPFGGVKSSGFGRFKGAHGLHAFCNIKSVLVDKDSAKIEANWYPYTPEKYRLFTRMTLGLFEGGWRSFVRFVVSGLKLEGYSKKARR
jgi:aldehyde dehydrogenase (NAD+)